MDNTSRLGPGHSRASTRTRGRVRLRRLLSAAIVLFALIAFGGGAAPVFGANPVTVNFTVATRDYDATTDATIVSCDLDGVTEGDDVTCDYAGATATFASADAGTTAVSGEDFVLAGEDAPNYEISETVGTGEISKADADCSSIVGYSDTYDAAAHGATGDCTGVAGDEAATGSSLDYGDSYTDYPGGTASWTFTGGTNYNDDSGDVAIDIAKADADCSSIVGYSDTYDAAAHGATGDCTGVAGDEAATGSSLDYGDSYTDYPGGTASWTFTGGTNYNDDSGDVAIDIAKADADCSSIVGYSDTYDAAAHGATGDCTGVAGDEAATGSSLDYGDSYTDYPGGTASWTFTGGTNYNDDSGDVAIDIAKADADCSSIVGYSDTYDAAAHGATGDCTGVAGDEAATGSSLDYGDSYTDYPGGTASWTFTGGTNYNDDSGDVAIDIAKADADCSSIVGYSDTYDAAAHGATGDCTGVAGDEAATGSSLDYGDSYTDYPGGTASWTFTGGTNYNDDSGDVAIDIAKADADCTSIVGYSDTYDAAFHGATGSCTGVDAGGTTASGSLNLGATFRNVPGGTANWAFTGGINYNDQSGNVPITISQRALHLTAVTQDRPYDGTVGSSATPTTSGLQGGTDSVSPLVQTYASKNVLGTLGSTLNVTTAMVNDGNSGNNYAVTLHSVAGTITKSPLTITALTNTKTADNNTTAAAIPAVTGTVFPGDSVEGTLSETYTTSAADFPKTLVPAGVVNDGNGGGNYSYTYINNSTGRIRPGPVDSLTFTAQPIDTKIGTPIYNVCAPGGSPCAASSVTVKVTARDQYLNLAGPGAPGADGANVAIPVVIRKDNLSGGIIGPASTPTLGGVASFGNTLVNPGTFIGKLNLFAITGSGASAKSTTSSLFRIVNDLAPCQGPLCKNNIGNGGTNKTLQYLYGQIKTSVGGSYAQTTLTTQFLGATSINNRCGNNKTINMPVELRAAGTDVSQTNTGYMLLILPKDTIKALGITSRGTNSFEICLGALFLGNGTTTYGTQTAPWLAKGGPANEVQDTLAADGDEYYRYWGTPANCGTSGLTGTDPCILLRTKQKADITALINQGVLSAGADANMRDSSIAIVIRKPAPWDGKGGMY